MPINRVILMGHLTRDPAFRRVPSGTAVCTLGLAVNRRYRNGEGAWQEETTFVDVVTWGRQAEVSAERLAKGSPVLLEGRLHLDRWETEEGQKRSRLRVVAETIRFLPKGPVGGTEEEGGPGGGEAPVQRGAPAAPPD